MIYLDLFVCLAYEVALHNDGITHLEAEALRELGNLHFFTRNIKLVFDVF